MATYKLDESKLKKICEKFSPALIGEKTLSTKKFSRSILKPNLRTSSNLSNEGFLSARVNELTSPKSSEKVPLSHRYNDKNISMTIDVNDARLRSMSEAVSDSEFKPRNFRLMSKRGKRK